MKKIFLILILIPFISLSQVINKSLYYDGLNREYIIYVPANYDGSINVPLFFSFHGGSGYASDHMQMTNINTISDTAGFIAVYPQGALDINGAEPGNTPSTSWLHKAPTTHNDVNFISSIIDTLSNEYTIDLDRIYACGYSEGGIFSYELACRLSNKIAAIGSVSGSMLTESFRTDYGFGNCSPAHPTAIILIPGTNDGSYHSLYSGFQPYYLSANEITNYWTSVNNTDLNPISSNINNTNTSDGSTVEKYEWKNGDNCVSITELKVVGGGHDWPGSFGNMDINASGEIWKFVSRFNINGMINCNTNQLQENIFTKKKEIINTFDQLGRFVKKEQENHLYFYIYNDGSVEKRINLK